MNATSFLLLCAVLSAAQTQPKFPVGKDTTFVTGPLTKEGYIDYEAALNDHLGNGITPDQNAVVLIWKAIGPKPEGAKMPAEFFRRLGIPEPPEQGDYLIGLERFLEDHLKLDATEIEAAYEEQRRASLRPWTHKDCPRIAQWIEANEKPIAIIIEASKRPQYYNPVISQHSAKEPGSLLSAPLSALQRCREAANILTARAMNRLAAGKVDDAWQDLLASHRLARLIARGGPLIEALVGFAIEQITVNANLAYIEGARLTSAQLLSRMKELKALPPFASLADKVNLAERIVYLEQLQLIRRNGVGFMERLAGEPTKGAGQRKPTKEELEQALSKLDWAAALRRANGWYDRMVAALRPSSHGERSKELDKLDKEVRKQLKDVRAAQLSILENLTKPGRLRAEAATGIADNLMSLLMPAIAKIQNAYDRIDQVDRNLHVAFALAAFHRDQGHYPRELVELEPRYLQNVPGDLFSGKALIYRPNDGGYLLYSIGVNGKDEGGRWYDDQPPGDDPSVRMPLPPIKPKK
jgi:hypothetical protein